MPWLTDTDDEVAYAQEEEDWLPHTQFDAHKDWNPQPGIKPPSIPDVHLLHLWRVHSNRRWRRLRFFLLNSQQVLHLIAQMTRVGLRLFRQQHVREPENLIPLNTLLDRLSNMSEEQLPPRYDLVSRNIPKKLGSRLCAKPGEVEYGWGLVLKQGFRPPIYAQWFVGLLLTATTVAIPVLLIYGTMNVARVGYDAFNPASVVVALTTLLFAVSKHVIGA